MQRGGGKPVIRKRHNGRKGNVQLLVMDALNISILTLEIPHCVVSFEATVLQPAKTDQRSALFCLKYSK